MAYHAQRIRVYASPREMKQGSQRARTRPQRAQHRVRDRRIERGDGERAWRRRALRVKGRGRVRVRVRVRVNPNPNPNPNPFPYLRRAGAGGSGGGDGGGLLPRVEQAEAGPHALVVDAHVDMQLEREPAGAAQARAGAQPEGDAPLRVVAAERVAAWLGLGLGLRLGLGLGLGLG